MIGAWTGGTRAHAEATREFRLTGRRERRSFLMPYAQPVHALVAADGVGKWIKRIANHAEHLRHSYLS
jgi:hypothetical protein